ncbi:MAG: glutamyl-tRNA amidotransferase [Coxiella sp. RIFCSPHIGHO2_12_FULL_44_14]|nr:MAG: glutamyl-tRNA amidotransferase [Coxiella sp. RIFCSPHIGHO2_12_FULL_44_14]
MTEATVHSLKQTIQQDMVAALRAQDKERLGTLRLLIAAIKQREIDGRTILNDRDVVGVIEKMIKQRRESIQQYEQGHRADLAKKEADEITVLQNYLPQPATAADIDAAIQRAIDRTQAGSMKDMGKVMGILKEELQGRADLSTVSAKVKDRLS